MIVLASSSAVRRKLLTDAGVPFEAVAPGVDEVAAKASLLAEGVRPREVADALAELKALRVSARRPELTVFGLTKIGAARGDRGASVDALGRLPGR